MSDLFDIANRERLQKQAPLAARMRPRTLDEYVGQDHIVGPGRLLRRAIQADQLGSLIFYGPPGTGKTTLAQVIANTTRAHFIAINAVLSGVKEIREAITTAQEYARQYGQRTILFVDEVHRFNKAQQDALLPWVENGTVIFIGATTENPYFEVNKALVSRSRIFQLLPLDDADLHKVIHAALDDTERGYGELQVTIDADAENHLVEVANGDARAVLNALELAVETTPTADGEHLNITLEIAEESIQRRAVLYDKEGDYHFDTVSAFIKSVRGSDPDATLYWMAKMIYAGESPRYIFRRMIILAGEDIGMADPQAMQVVMSCAQAFEQIGMPEGRFPLALAALYLSTARKSNTAMAFFDALAQVEKEADSGVPNHLRDGNRDAEGFGHGEGYLYPHAYQDHWVAQQYLPSSLQGKVFYQPSDQGYEAAIQVEVARKREAQLAAMLEGEGALGPVEILTWSPDDPARDRWLQRTISSSGDRLGRVRDRILDGAHLSRHANLLDLRAGSGMITWEALRRVPEGSVTALARTARDADALREMANRLEGVRQPTVLQGALTELPSMLDLREATSEGAAPTQFDAIVGYNALLDESDQANAAALLGELLVPRGVVCLAERIPRHTQRLFRLEGIGDVPLDLAKRWAAAEEAIYATGDALTAWDAGELVRAFEMAGFNVAWETQEEASDFQVTPQVLQRWFGAGTTERPSYAEQIGRLLDAKDIEHVRRRLEALSGKTVQWGSRTLYLVATRRDR